jgi:hypothetical protein
VQWIPRYVRLTQQFNQSLERSACLHVLVLISRVILLPVQQVPVRQAPTQDGKRRTRPNHSPFPPSLPRFFILPFLIISRLFPSSDNTYRHKAANHAVAVHAPFYLIFFILLCTLTLSLYNSLHRHPRGCLYDTKHRHSRQVVRMYLSYSSSRVSSFSIKKLLCLSPFISYSLV